MNKENFPDNASTMESAKQHIISQLDRLDVHQLRRLAISLSIVSSDEIVFEEKEGFKKKITNCVEGIKTIAELQTVRNKIKNIDELA